MALSALYQRLGEGEIEVQPTLNVHHLILQRDFRPLEGNLFALDESRNGDIPQVTKEENIFFTSLL